MKRIVFLDYVRVFACFLVMMVHSSELFYGAPGPDFINASPKLEFAVRKAKKWLYSEVFLCQEESFCEGGIIFG